MVCRVCRGGGLAINSVEPRRNQSQCLLSNTSLSFGGLAGESIVLDLTT